MSTSTHTHSLNLDYLDYHIYFRVWDHGKVHFVEYWKARGKGRAAYLPEGCQQVPKYIEKIFLSPGSIAGWQPSVNVLGMGKGSGACARFNGLFFGTFPKSGNAFFSFSFFVYAAFRFECKIN